RYRDTKGTKRWIDNAHGGAHIRFTGDVHKAGIFTGIPTCAGGECGIKVLGGPTKSGSAGSTCPSVTPGISFWGNPKMHDSMRYVRWGIRSLSLLAFPQVSTTEFAV
ncbi:hypothetical protein M405DRAFT_811505, partial [Rhizopogon salebrosus TDB-379]